MTFRKYRSVAASLLFLFISCSPVCGQNYQRTLNDLNFKINRLKALILEKKQDGVDVRVAQIAVDVTEQFKRFAEWDRTHRSELKKVIETWEPVRDRARTIASEMPVKQLQGCTSIVDVAIAELQDQTAESLPASSFEVDLSVARVIDGNYYQGTRPVFPHSILWAPLDLPKSFGQFSLGYMHPDYLNAEGDPINAGQKSWFSSEMDLISNRGRKAYLFLGHVAPKWLQSSTLAHGRTQFIDYDIDKSGIRLWWRQLIGQLGPVFFNHPVSMNITLLANEPHWFSTENPWGYFAVSNATLTKYHNWLKRKYSSIEELNNNWNTDYDDFSEIIVRTPISRDLQGTGYWFDWCWFNMYRSRSFFQFLDLQVRAVSPNSLNHVKIPSQLFLETGHDHGIDWVHLASVMGIMGIDATVTSQDGISRFEKSTRELRYSIDWTPSCAAMDLLKSVKPRKMIFDSEWHAISSLHWRNENMSENYVRSCLWMHHLSGMGINQSWYWGRDSNGVPISNNQNEFYGSLTTQPKALNAYLKTMVEVNDHGANVVNVVNSARPVGLLYSEYSAIQDPNYLKNFSEVYQALRFTGLRVRIVPSRHVRWTKVDALVIPPTRYVDSKFVPAIQSRAALTPTMIQIGTGNLALNAYGNPHSSEQTAFLNQISRVDMGTAEQLHERFTNALATEIGKANPATNSAGKPPWGLLQFSGKDVEDQQGEFLVLINVLTKSITVNTGSKTITLHPMETRILRD